MRLIFMVEEPSMKEVLEIILPKVLPENKEKPLIITHNGKNDLVASIPRKLKGWQNPDDKFIIVHDQDSSECKQLKAYLLTLCKNSRNDVLVRIACKELEAWYFGDLPAVSLAYGKDFTKLAGKKKYREPDNIGNPKDEIRKLIPSHQQITGAKLIAQHMNIEQNSSKSFNVFVSGIKNLIAS